MLQLESFRTDVYYSNEKKEYRNVDIKYSDLKFERGVYLLDLDRYFKKKEELGIGQDFNFIFSLHKNDLVGIRSAKSKDIQIYIDLFHQGLIIRMKVSANP